MDHYSVDTYEELRKARASNLKASLIFASILTVVLISDTLLIILAKEEYRLNFIISAVITVLFTWFAIYFFTNIYNDINNRYRYFKGYESGLHSTDEVEIIKSSDTLSYVNGLYVYPIAVRYLSNNLEKKDKIIYTLNKDLDLKKGDKLTITTYQRILIKMEKHHD